MTACVHVSALSKFFWHLIRLIDISNHIAGDATAPFVQRLFGFTFGIGLPEEFVKIIPIWFVIDRRDEVSWNDALIVGLTSGAAFGVAEGIVYSEHYYNGVCLHRYRSLQCSHRPL